MKMILLLTMLPPKGRDRSLLLRSPEAKGRRVGSKRGNE